MHGSFKVWIFCLPWVELMFNEKGARMHHVHCMVCTFVEGKKKIVGPKLNNLLKHQGHHKAKVSMFGVDDGSFYFNKDYVHAKNEWCYTSTNYPFVLDRL
jgi:hypothetical protein